MRCHDKVIETENVLQWAKTERELVGKCFILLNI